MPFAPCWRVVSCQRHHLELRFRCSAETAETARRAGWRSPRVGSLRLLVLLRLLLCLLRLVWLLLCWRLDETTIATLLLRIARIIALHPMHLRGSHTQ